MTFRLLSHFKQSPFDRLFNDNEAWIELRDAIELIVRCYVTNKTKTPVSSHVAINKLIFINYYNVSHVFGEIIVWLILDQVARYDLKWSLSNSKNHQMRV